MRGVHMSCNNCQCKPNGYWLWTDDNGYVCERCKTPASRYGVAGDVYYEPPTEIKFCPKCGLRLLKPEVKYKNENGLLIEELNECDYEHNNLDDGRKEYESESQSNKKEET